MVGTGLNLLCVLSCFLLLPWQTVLGEGYPLHKQDFVVPLTDKNFEHETQASTGGTTGSWLVWFHGPRDETAIAGEVPEPDFWTEHHVILASVDATQHMSTRRRFGVTRLPSFIFVHKGKYYRLDKPDEGYVFNWDMIQKFVIERYATTEVYDIPPPRTMKDDVVDVIEKIRQEFGGVYFQYLAYFLCFILFVSLLDHLFSDKKGKEKQR